MSLRERERERERETPLPNKARAYKIYNEYFQFASAGMC